MHCRFERCGDIVYVTPALFNSQSLILHSLFSILFFPSLINLFPFFQLFAFFVCFVFDPDGDAGEFFIGVLDDDSLTIPATYGK